ncbi:MAG TPA: 16S rRNA (cytosine(1402)-N(4))-methyltransferase RsmH [bacterium]|jgi:16S rRNA (cytosine1402-N4)-methyltransferase|nr:16S rRNA (cytosine(1402)-N(4))-methyltransferase RsmH [bacterium]
MYFQHEPVLLPEVLSYLACQSEGLIIDCTVGGAGHAEAILEKTSPSGSLLAIDQDQAALSAAARRLRKYGRRVGLVKGNFRQVEEIWRGSGLASPIGILFDLGLSSPQVDQKERGFSYQADAPLDMRMDTTQQTTAATIVNELSENELANIIKRYGEERWAARISKFICQRRRQEPINTTAQLVDVIKSAIPAAARRRGPHPARRTFQALRIAVNDELEALSRGLDGAREIIAPGGTICAISFHSLEDRIVKRSFRAWALQGEYTVLTKKPLVPTFEETERNPRSRSAKLRAIRRRS